MQERDNTVGQVPDKLLLMWSNEQLRDRELEMADLDEDLKDGVRLINMLEVVTGKGCGKYVKQPKMEIQRYNNTQIAFEFMAKVGVKLVNIGNTDVTDGNPKLVRGLIWTLMENYQFGKPYAEAKNELLAWIQSKIPEYHITRFGQQWNDGKALCALVNAISPGTCPDHAALDGNSHLANVNKGMGMALEYYKIPRIIDALDMIDPHVAEPLLVTYLSYFPSATPVYVNNAARAKAFGPGLKEGVVFKESSFKVAMPGAETGKLEVRVEGPDTTCKPLVTDSGAGNYDVVFTPKAPGDYLVHVTVDGEHVPGSAFKVLVKPNFARDSRVEGDGLASGTVRVPASFQIFAAAGEGEAPPKVAVEIRGPSGGVQPVMKQLSPGNTHVTYTPAERGSHEIRVLLGNDHIGGSPFTATIEDNAAESTTAEGPGLVDGMATVPGDFTVRAPKAGRVEVKVEGPALCGAEPEIKEAGPKGVYACRYFPEVAGDYMVHVKFDGEEVPHSPWRVPIVPEDPVEAAKRDPRVCQCVQCEPNMFDQRYCRVCLKWVTEHYLLLRKEGRLNAKEDKIKGSFRVKATGT